MTKIFLIRHGEVTWNRQACYTGWTDLPLTAKGIAQAERVAGRLRAEPLRAVYCSDLQRSRITAEIIATSQGLTPVADPDLRELNYGEWEGVAEKRLPVEFPELYQAWVANPAGVATPSGESFSQLLTRVTAATDRITSAYPEGSVAIVGHKSVNRVLLCHWLGVDINLYKRVGQDNVAISTVSHTPERVVVDCVNDRCHVSGGLATGGD
jgi:alpha-ribazole phosphatase